MPWYEYRCHKCGETVEIQKPMAQDDPKFHGGDSGCGGGLEQVLSVATIKFKGRGWYCTDYGKGK
jgi:putative FmdB family regulatory protein